MRVIAGILLALGILAVLVPIVALILTYLAERNGCIDHPRRPLECPDLNPETQSRLAFIAGHASVGGFILWWFFVAGTLFTIANRISWILGLAPLLTGTGKVATRDPLEQNTFDHGGEQDHRCTPTVRRNRR